MATQLTRKQFGALVKKARNAANLSQGALAKAAGLPSWAIPQLEGGRAIGPERIAAVAKYLKIDAPEEFKRQRSAAAPAKKSADRTLSAPRFAAPASSIRLGEAIDRVLDVLDLVSPTDRNTIITIATERYQNS